jgi:hypothetical protein
MRKVPFCEVLDVSAGQMRLVHSLGFRRVVWIYAAAAEGYKFPASDACFRGFRVVLNGSVPGFVPRMLMDPDVGLFRADGQPPPTPNTSPVCQP